MTIVSTLPKVSVVIPAYNAEAFLEEAIESVLDLEGCDVEIIVVDDGSSDGTAAVVSNYGDAITLMSQENQGLTSARNAGLGVARADYVAFLDSDDRFLSNKIVLQALRLDREPSLGLVASGCRYVDREGKPFGYLAQAVSEDPELARPYQDLLLHGSAEWFGSPREETDEGFYERILEVLLQEVNGSTWTVAGLKATEARRRFYHACLRRDRRAAGRAWLRSVRYDRSWLRNRGAFSTLLRTISARGAS